MKNQGRITFLNFLIYALAAFLPAAYFLHHQWGSRENIPLALYLIGSQVLIAVATHFTVGYWPADYSGHTRDDEKKRAQIGHLLLGICAHIISIGIIYWGYTEW